MRPELMLAFCLCFGSCTLLQTTVNQGTMTPKPDDSTPRQSQQQETAEGGETMGLATVKAPELTPVTE